MMDRRAVYVYKWTGEDEFIGLALNVHIYNGKLRFYDTNRPHEIEGKVTSEDEKGFIFMSSGYMPGEWQFKLLTIEDFRRKYYKLVVDGDILAAKIKTTEDLYEWYRKQFKIF